MKTSLNKSENIHPLAMEVVMLHESQIPDYVAKNMQKIEESGIDYLDLREIGLLLLDWEAKYSEAMDMKNTEKRLSGYRKITNILSRLKIYF